MNKSTSVAIVKNSQGKILITERIGVEQSPNSQDNFWLFPGIVFSDEDTVKDALAKAVRHKTGYKIIVEKKISERKHPDIPAKKHVYYECSLATLSVSPIERVHETQKVKWVEPEEIKDYFTTSLDPGVAKYLGIDVFPAKSLDK